MIISESGTIAIAKPVTTYHEASPLGYKTASVSISMEYTNYTESDIYIKTQNNLPLVVEPNTLTRSTNNDRPHLEVKISYTLHSNGSIQKSLDIVNRLEANGNLLLGDAEVMKERLINMHRNDANRRNKTNFTFSILRCVTELELDGKEIVILRECDLVVSKHAEALSKPHPNSNEGLQQYDRRRQKEYHEHAGVFVRVVDNLMLAKVRYYYSAKQLITVPSIVNPSAEDGVYVTLSSMAEDGLVKAESRFIGFEDAEEQLGLFRSQEEALSHGNPEIAIRAEEARSKTEERRLATELNNMKHHAAMAELKQKDELARIQHALELTKAENTQLKESLDVRKTVREDSFEVLKKDRDWEFEFRKRDRDDFYEDRKYRRGDFYEDRSYERKDSSEMLKYVSAFAIGLVTTYAMMNKAGSK